MSGVPESSHGGGLLESAVVSLTAAQIQTLATAHPALTPTPSTSQVVVPRYVAAFYTPGAAAYAGTYDTAVFVGDAAHLTPMWDAKPWASFNGLLATLSPDIMAFMDFAFFIGDIANGPVSTSAGQPARLGTSSNPTTGDGTLKIVTSYSLLDVPA